MQPVVFSREWFDQHQRALLWLLNAPILGRWFRWVLCIRRHDVGYRRRIARLYPHAYEVTNRDGSRTLDVRTHAKYAKRLYYAFRPFWWTLHAWDALIANPFVPALNAGFDTLTAYPDPDPETTTIDGTIGRVDAVTGESWASLIGGAGNTADNPFASSVSINASSDGADLWKRFGRSVYLFDTSPIAGGTVTAAVLSIYGKGKSDNRGITPDVDIYTASPASNTALATSDYGNVGATSQTGSPITYASWSTSAYNDFTLDATGIGNVATAGISKFSKRNASYDAAGVAPTWAFGDETAVVEGYFADEAGTSTDPKLVVTYTPQGRNRVVLDQNRTSAVANFTNAASTSLAFSSAVSAGQLLTLCFTGGSSGGSSLGFISTVTDTVNAAGKWQRAVRQASTVGGSSLRAEIWYAPNSSAGTPTVTVSLASTFAGRCLFGIQSWSLASTISTAVLGTVTSTAGNSSNLTTPTMSSLSSGSVVISVWKTSAGVTNRTNPSGWSTIAPQNSTRENTFYVLRTDATDISTKWQITAASQYVVAMAEFKGSTFTPSTSGSNQRNYLTLLGVQ